jgi:hypothetical protein
VGEEFPVQHRCTVCGNLVRYVSECRDGNRRCEPCFDAYWGFSQEHGPEAWDVPDASPGKVMVLFTVVVAVLVAVILGLSW